MPSARLPLTHLIESRTADTSKDSRTVNALFEKQGDKIFLVKRPGLGLLNTTPALSTGVAQGLTSWNDYIVAVHSNSVYAIQAGNPTSLSTKLGTVVGSTVPFSFTHTAADQELVFHNGSNLYVVTQSGMVVSEPISGANVGSVKIDINGFGYAAYSTVTITNSATPAVITKTAHGLVAGQGVKFATTGVLPIGITPSVTYAVLTVLTANTFTIAATATPTVAINTSGGQSGVHSMGASPVVTFGTSAGVTATGTAVVVNTRVTEIVLTNSGGSGHIATPSVTITAPPAAVTATGTIARLEHGDYSGVYNGQVTITNGGGPYSSPPTVTFSDARNSLNQYIGGNPGGTAGYAVLTNGIVTAVNLTSNGNGLYYATTVTLSAPESTPATATAAMSSTITGPYAYGMEYLDGYCYIMKTNGRVHNSALEDPTSWNSVDYISSESDPDEGVALVKQLNYLVAFNKLSTDFFYNAGNATGSPLAANKQAKLELGCANGASVAKADMTVLWVGQSKTQGRSVYMLAGLSPQKVSTRYIDKYLNRDAMLTCYSYVAKVAGHTMYFLTLPDSNITLVYDLDEQVWYQWTSQSGAVETYFRGIYYTGNVEAAPGLYIQNDTDGKVYKMSPEYTKDDTEDIYFRAVSANLDSGSNKRKVVSNVEVIGDKVQGNVSIRHSSNDYASWSTYRTVNLINRRPRLFQLGEYRRRAWEVFSSADIPIRLEALEINFGINEQGGGSE